MDLATNGAPKPAASTQLAAPTIPGRMTPLLPENFADALKMAETLSKSSIVPKAYQGQPGNVFAAIMLAAELRITPMLAMREVFFLDDRPVLYAEMKVALVMRESDCEYFRCVHSDARKATFETKRRGHPAPQQLTVTIEEIPETLRKKDNWRNFTANMLRWRCEGWLCDMVYPDKVMGLKSREEMEDSIEMRQGHDGTYAAVAQGTQAPAAPPATQIQEAKFEPVVVGKAEEQPKATDNAPDPVEVLFSDLKHASRPADLDAVAQRGRELLPKGHPRRDEFGRAVNAARARAKGA